LPFSFFADARRQRRMQPKLHAEITENKQNDHQNGAESSANDEG
jgi:hypothetical protein